MISGNFWIFQASDFGNNYNDVKNFTYYPVITYTYFLAFFECTVICGALKMYKFFFIKGQEIIL